MAYVDLLICTKKKCYVYSFRGKYKYVLTPFITDDIYRLRTDFDNMHVPLHFERSYAVFHCLRLVACLPEAPRPRIRVSAKSSRTVCPPLLVANRAFCDRGDRVFPVRHFSST